ncbi:uncharacterized protein LOC117649891 isoform X2 [Thrips palmi]|nr:uncharacterized protein LOC117649891 isoform X2 [Thrips palmi]
MSLLGECRDINGLAVKHGLMYMAGPGECHQCVCESGVPKNCQDVMCHQPQNCSTFRKGARCCDFVCLDDLSSGKTDVVSLEGDFGLRLIASVITAILSFSLLFFLIHRLRQRKIRSGRQNRQMNEDERSLGSIGYITGSLGYLPGAMERYEEPAAHFPHYPLWKPPGNYFPRGEAPPPYEEAVAATRAEALAVAMASGNLHSAHPNYSRDALMGVSACNYNTYSAGNLLSGTAHRTIPINLATSASFTLQPDRYDDNPAAGGASCVSVSAGTVQVTATVTGPQIPRPDLLHSDIALIRQGDPSSRSSTLRRSDMTTRAEISHRPDQNLRADVGRNHRPEAFQWSDAPHRPDAGHRSDGVHCPDSAHCSNSSHRTDAGHRSDNNHRLETGLQLETVHGMDGIPRTELNQYSDSHRNDVNHRPDMPHRKETPHHLDPSHSHIQVDINDRSSHRPDNHHRHDFSHRDVGHRDMWRQDANDSVNFRGDERRLPSIPLPENSHSLPPHHSHSIHHQVHNVGQTLHQTATIHTHSYGRQLQTTTVGHMEIPAPIPGPDLDPKDRKAGSSKMVIPQLANVPKSGTGVYEDSFHTAVIDSSHLHTATLRRGKHHSTAGNGMVTLRRNPVPVATPTLKMVPSQPMLSDSTCVASSGMPGPTSSSSAISIPPPTIPSMEAQSNMACVSAPSTASVMAAIVAASPPRCTCPKASSPRCTCPGSCHSSIMSLAVNEASLPQNSNVSLAQAGLDDNDDYRSECENCKSTHSSNYYLDAEEPEPEITMTLHRKPADTSEENGNAYYRTSLTLPTRHRVIPLHGSGARDNWFSSMPESSSDDESDE